MQFALSGNRNKAPIKEPSGIILTACATQVDWLVLALPCVYNWRWKWYSPRCWTKTI